MPLSKARDKERKQRERARSRLDKLLRPPQVPKPVQPTIIDAVSPSIRREGYGKASSTVILEIDADGNVIPEAT